MPKSAFARAAFLTVGAIFVATPVFAQSNTGAGASGPGTTDSNWNVTWAGPTNGSGTAVQVASPPSPWANTSPNSFWISTNASASLPDGTGDNAARYTYTWEQVFTTASNSPVQMTVWTDNYFDGYTFNGVFTAVSPVAPPPGDFAQPQARVFTLDPSTTGTNTLVLNTQGDGQTDGVNVGFSSVPEPSSIALLGTGLVGLVPMVRRRRKA